MDESKSLTDSIDGEDDDFDRRRAAGPFIGVITVTAVLYLAKDLLLPIAMAAILAVIFSPVANRLDKLVGRFVSAALLVLAATMAVGGIGYFLTVELTSVAVEVAAYSDNIGTKLAALEKNTPHWLQRIEQGITSVKQHVEKTSPKPKANSTAVLSPPSSIPSVSDVLKQTIPILAAFGESLLIIVLLFFLLYGRRDLRDRFVRLAARGRITIAGEAIETAGHTVGHYLLLFALINLGYGIAVGLTVWLLGLPNPEFWGGLAFLLRFIPYLGAPSSAILPALVAFAVFPGWSKTFEVLGSFILFDQIAAQLVEPFLIGHGIGVSPVALLISAMYWAWLWGIPGLLLATPLTACLKVAGDYIPPLGFLGILLGADSASDDYQEYYRQLLELNQTGARALAIRYCDEHGLESTFNNVFAPAVLLMGSERKLDHISQGNQQLILTTTHDLIVELGNRFDKPRSTRRLRVLGVCPPGESHFLGLLMLLELLRQDGAAATFIGENKSLTEVQDFVKRYAPDVICLSCSTDECLPSAIELVRILKSDSPQLMIIAGGCAAQESFQLQAAGCSRVFSSRTEARRAIKRFAMQRARTRMTRENLPFRSGVTAGPNADAIERTTGSTSE
jgi:predicted PurR-regulated permease PerM/methylmalonyl-CoA mutase cobalamin-binding subunit